MKIQEMKRVTIKQDWKSLFEGLDIEGDVEVAILEDGISVSAQGYGNTPQAGTWLPASIAAVVHELHIITIYKNFEKRPATPAEKEKYPRVHYMYRPKTV